MFKLTVGFIFICLIVANREREEAAAGAGITIGSGDRCDETGKKTTNDANLTESVGEGGSGNWEKECEKVPDGDKPVCAECFEKDDNEIEFGDCMRRHERANMRTRFWDNPLSRTTRSIVKLYWAGPFDPSNGHLTHDTYYKTVCHNEDGEAKSHQECRSDVIRSDNTPTFYHTCEFVSDTLTKCEFRFYTKGHSVGGENSMIGSLMPEIQFTGDDELGTVTWEATEEEPGVLVRHYEIKIEGAKENFKRAPVAYISVLPQVHLNDILNNCLRMCGSILLPMILAMSSFFRFS